MKTYIGKQYIPRDNSYSKNLSNSNGLNFVRLAGIPYNNTKAQVTTIVSEPFDILITEHSKPDKHKFVLVETNRGETYLVMFHEKGIVNETNTIESIFERDEERNKSLYW